MTLDRCSRVSVWKRRRVEPELKAIQMPTPATTMWDTTMPSSWIGYQYHAETPSAQTPADPGHIAGLTGGKGNQDCQTLLHSHIGNMQRGRMRPRGQLRSTVG
ncbi:hypothetical protein EYF80_049292 [Liparis tanakae]|uniref:Uncharacterized protein n=1 Tax=Liparis tanakae TaxID=230148 RepID=A0A4Z2FID9_9TELE|nr:hypothetical protein EYF80_049292 [Liparis tanakae]